MKKKHTCMLRELAESWRDKVAVCWWYGQSYDMSSWWTTEERQKKPDGRHAKMRAETAEKNKSRPQRGGGFSLNLYLPGVSRWFGVISHVFISYPISCDITRYDISRYRSKRLFGGRTSEEVIFIRKYISVRPYGGTQSADLDAVLRKNKNNPLRDIATNKNDIVSQLADCSKQ